MRRVMENEWMQPRRRRHRWIFPVILLLLAAAAAAGWYVVFRVNQFSLSVVPEGAPEMTLEYGQPYVDPGARVYLRGTLIFPNGVEPGISPDIEQHVADGKLGKHTVTYSADLRSLHARAERTVRVVDTQCPVITLTPDPPEKLQPGTVYEESGFSAWDNFDGDLTDRVIREETEGLVTYTVTDSSGNPAYAERKIPVVDRTPPVITLEGGSPCTVQLGTRFTDPGYQAEDNLDGDVTEAVQVSGEVDWLTPGTYPVTYTVSDAMGNETTVVRDFVITGQPLQNTVEPGGKTVYLTFDDGPGPYTHALLQVLKKYNVKATFFVVGDKNPDLLREIVREGHSIAIHTSCHDYEKIYSDPQAYFDDLYNMQAVILRETGVETWLMRFPGGSSNTVSRRFRKGIMTTLTRAVQSAGFRYFDWNVDSDDAGGAHTAKKVRQNVIEGLQNHRVSVVLQHDIHDYSVDAVEDILVWGQEHGYQFLPLQDDSPTMHHGVNN